MDVQRMSPAMHALSPKPEHAQRHSSTDSHSSSSSNASAYSNLSLGRSPFDRQDTDTSLESAPSSSGHKPHSDGMKLAIVKQAPPSPSPARITLPNELLRALSSDMVTSLSIQQSPIIATQLVESPPPHDPPEHWPHFAASRAPLRSNTLPSAAFVNFAPPVNSAPKPHDEPTPSSSTWNVEFRGVRKLVRWVSGKHSPRPKPKSDDPAMAKTPGQLSSEKPLKHVSPVITQPSYSLDRGRSRKALLPSQLALQPPADSPPPVPPKARSVSIHFQSISRDNSLQHHPVPSAHHQTRVGSSARHGNVLVVSTTDAPTKNRQDHVEDVYEQLSAALTSPAPIMSASAMLSPSPSSPPPLSRRRSVLTKQHQRRPSSTLTTNSGAPHRNSSFSIASSTAGTQSENNASLTSRLKRTFSLNGKELRSTTNQATVSMSDIGHGVSSSMSDLGHSTIATEWLKRHPNSTLSLPPTKRRSTKLVKPRPLVKSSSSNTRQDSSPHQMRTPTDSMPSTEKGYFSSPSTPTSSLPRKLTKRSVPASAYSSRHVSSGVPSFLEALPEIQPSGPLDPYYPHSTPSPPPSVPPLKTRIFSLGPDEEEERDDHEKGLFPNGRLRAYSASDSPESRSQSGFGLGLAPNPARPPLRHASSSLRRWTVAVAEIPDDVEFLKVLDMQLERGGASSIGMHDDTAIGADGEFDPARKWDQARRAMFCVRELVRTERSYQDYLISASHLEDMHASNAPLLFAYLPRLISASQLMTSAMEDDPSAWGVSSAFLNAAENLERVLIAWCTIVADVISDLSTASHSSHYTFLRRNNSGPVHRSTISVNGRDHKSTLAPRRAESVSEDGQWLHKRPHSTASVMAGFPWRRSSMSHTTLPSPLPMTRARTGDGSKGLTLQDIAIMPTQRVGRYVLLYKDLLKHTPAASPSFSLVQSAVDTAVRIAHRCNDAQMNLSFIVPSE